MAKAEYTPEITSDIVELWNMGNGRTVEEIHQDFFPQFGVRSITGKLVSLGLFTKQPKTQKQKSASLRKDDIAQSIGAFMPDLAESDVDSIANSSKPALIAMLAILKFSEEAVALMLGEIDDENIEAALMQMEADEADQNFDQPEIEPVI